MKKLFRQYYPQGCDHFIIGTRDRLIDCRVRCVMKSRISLEEISHLWQLVAYRLVKSSMSQRNPLRQLKAIRAVIADVRSAFPDLPDRAFRDGNTMMTAWLLPTFAYGRQWANFWREALRGYIGNPLWFTNPLRRAHWFRLRIVLNVLARMALRDRRPLALLRDAELGGAKPFAYLGT